MSVETLPILTQFGSPEAGPVPLLAQLELGHLDPTAIEPLQIDDHSYDTQIVTSVRDCLGRELLLAIWTNSSADGAAPQAADFLVCTRSESRDTWWLTHDVRIDSEQERTSLKLHLSHNLPGLTACSTEIACLILDGQDSRFSSRQAVGPLVPLRTGAAAQLLQN